MDVLIVTAVEPGLRGELSRWMIEPEAGVFVGRLPSGVRERLWAKVRAEAEEGSAVLVCAAPTEQGFVVRRHGERTREPVDYDGVTLIRRRIARREESG